MPHIPHRTAPGMHASDGTHPGYSRGVGEGGEGSRPERVLSGKAGPVINARMPDPCFTQPAN